MSKATVCLACGGILLFSLSCRKDVREKVSGPKIHFQENEHDFGEVLPGSKQEYSFTFKNSGTESLEVIKLSPSCGCTVAELDQKVIAPNEEGEIRVAFNIPPNPDPVSHSVLVETNDSSNPKIGLFVRADPEWPVAISPERVHIVAAVRHRKIKRTIELYSPSAKGFTVSKILPSSPSITVDLISSNDRREKFDVEFIVDELGPFAEEIVFHLDNPDRPKITLPITGEAVGASQVSPTRIILGKSSGSEVITRELAVSAKKITDVKIESENWKLVSWESLQDSSEQNQIYISIQVPDAFGYHRCEMELYSDEEVIAVVPVSCVIPEK